MRSNAWPNGLLQRFAFASSLSAQHGLHFGERLFNGREIGRIGGQQQQTVPFGFDGLLDPASQVNAQIIQDDDLSRLEAGGEPLLDVDLKGGRIGGSIQQHGFPHARER
jgi:hypothetical protein